MTHSIMTFLKFGQEEHIKDLYYNGTIYMNSIQSFRSIEDGELRGDKYEGVSRVENYPAGQFEIPKLGHKVNYLALHVRESYETILGNIFSLYCVSSHGWENPYDFKIDEKIKKFGSHCLMIKDIPKFLSLIEKKLKEQKVVCQHDFVEYYDKEKVNKEITLFEKPLEFEYQKEFRFYVERHSDQPFIFSIGSLTNIAEICAAKDVVDTLKFTTNRKT